ncbi:MAG TPA: SH3 domain-containing protein [Candidatus Magasanikbacteria bacterium]|nr:SH3 domain-containing protein [Candidatus Magasanikbacteria bacterium]
MNKKIFIWLIAAFIGAGLFAGYVLATEEDGFEDGALVKIKNQKTIYLIEEGLKRPFLNPEAFKAYGYSWYEVETVTEEEIADFETGPYIKTPTILIKANKLFIRKWPTRFSKILATAQKDETYELIDNNGSWYKIKGGEKITGWISARYAIILDEEMDEFVATKEEAKKEELKTETTKTEETKTEIKNETPTATETAPTKSLTLTYLGNGKFSWKKVGTFSQGYKLVWSKTANPTYPLRDSDKYAFYSEPETSVGYVNAFAGEGKYYVRVCEYLGGKCGIYSNQVTITLLGDTEKAVEKETAQAVTSITLISLGDGKLSWKVNGYSKNGFKVVWSQNSMPTYPTRDGDQYHYYSEPTKTSDIVDNFSGEGKYYVRVCEYLGGKCGIYSNQIEINL